MPSLTRTAQADGADAPTCDTAMPSWTVADLREEVIQAEEKLLASKRATVAQLKAELEKTAKSLRNTEEEVSVIEAQLRWRKLMSDVKACSKVSSGEASLQAAVDVFMASLKAPESYNEEEEGVPYIDTDDYGDLSPVEGVVDDTLAGVLEAIYSSPSSSADLTSADGVQQVKSRTDDSTGPNEALSATPMSHWCRRDGLLMLLVVSVHIGKLWNYCKELSDEERENLPLRDIELIVESIANAWQTVLYEQPIEGREEWIEIVSMFLGEPFDSCA